MSEMEGQHRPCGSGRAAGACRVGRRQRPARPDRDKPGTPSIPRNRDVSPIGENHLRKASAKPPAQHVDHRGRLAAAIGMYRIGPQPGGADLLSSIFRNPQSETGNALRSTFGLFLAFFRDDPGSCIRCLFCQPRGLEGCRQFVPFSGLLIYDEPGFGGGAIHRRQRCGRGRTKQIFRLGQHTDPPEGFSPAMWPDRLSGEIRRVPACWRTRGHHDRTRFRRSPPDRPRCC